MQYHIEHHMFPAVPFFNMPKLRAAIAHDLPPATQGLSDTWKEMLEVRRKQLEDSEYVLIPELPNLANDVKGNDAAEYFLKKAFSVIEKTKQDIRDLAIDPNRIGDYKYLDLTIGKNFETIKDLLMKIEKLIYISS